MHFTAPPVWELLVTTLLFLAVAGVASALGASMGHDARTQACEKVAAGEQAPGLLPGLVIDCPAP